MNNQVQIFIERWRASGAAERANHPLFITELCDLIGVERPQPKQAIESDNAYVFEKAVPSPSGSTNFIDLYKRGSFVLEAKQGSDQVDAGSKTGVLSAGAAHRQKARKRGTAVRGTGGWDTALEKARKQGQGYIRNLPPEELIGDGSNSGGSNSGGRPPFLIVVDVGYTIDLYAEFTRTGGHYAPFPSPTNYRIHLDDLHNGETRDLLYQIWTDPQALDPARRSARVTREIADRLARLAKSLEGKHDPQLVANFLMRALFTMFAEDVDLLPEKRRLFGDFTTADSSLQWRLV